MSFKIKHNKKKKNAHSETSTPQTYSTTTESPTPPSGDTSSNTSASSKTHAPSSGSKCGTTTSTPHIFTPQTSTTPAADYHRQENALIKQGYLNVPMLFGYVCAMREAHGLKPFTSRQSLEATLYRRNLPHILVHFGNSTKVYRRWYKRDETVAALCEIRQKDHDTFLSNPATDAELISGDWLNLTATHRLTGIQKKRISKIGSDHLQLTRLHPVTNDRLYHVPSVRDYGYWRTTSYIRQHFGDTAADALIALRPQRKYTTGGCTKTLVYCPDLAHL